MIFIVCVVKFVFRCSYVINGSHIPVDDITYRVALFFQMVEWYCPLGFLILSVLSIEKE
jgi:hypothetical protein